MTVDTTTVLTTITNQLAALRTDRVRAVSEEQVATLLTAVRNAAAAATPDDVRVTGRLYGGFVPGSYRYAADADQVDVMVDLMTGAVTGSARRVRVQRRVCGVGTTIIVRAARAGQVDGRIVTKAA